MMKGKHLHFVGAFLKNSMKECDLLGNKNKEKKCFEKVIKCRNIKGTFAKEVYSILLENIELINFDPERPDIYINTKREIIGIEHCQVDVLFRIKKGNSQSVFCTQESTSKRLVEKYKDEIVLEEDIENGKAVSSVLSMVKDKIDAKSDFDYIKFIESFKKITSEHNLRGDDYRENLRKIEPGKSIRLGCLIELSYPKEKIYIVRDSKGERKQAINGIPITIDIINVIKSMNRFDFVILCMSCFDEIKTTKDTVCYYFNPSEIEDGIHEQAIKVVHSFSLPNPLGLPYKPKVEFPQSTIRREEGRISFSMEVSPKEEKEKKK